MKNIKAVFIDYSGTLSQEMCKATMKFVDIISKNSRLNDPNTIIKYWWKSITELENKSYRENYLTQDEITDISLKKMVEEFELKTDLNILHELCREYWAKAPLFDDVKPFFKECPYPIYIITNNSIQYVDVAIKDNELNPAGVICGDMVKAYKPSKEIFLKALEVSNCSKEEVVHIGDSEKTDVLGARSVGITPILLNRKNREVKTDVIVIKDLFEALEILKNKVIN